MDSGVSWGRLLALWLGLACLLPGGLPGAEAPSPGYVISTWRMAEGLPLDKVRAVLQTSDGYLWVATFNGLARFDGVRFRIFNAANTPELRNDLITCLFEDRQQQLWIGSETGEITVFSGDGFKSMPCGREWRSAPVQRFVQDGEGTVWALNRLGLLLPFRKGYPGATLRSSAALPYDQVCADNQSRLWASRGRMLVQLPERVATQQSLEAPLTFEGAPVVFPSQRGGLWIIDHNRVRRWDQGKWVEDRGRHNWRQLTASTLLETRSGQVVVGTPDQGLDILEANGQVVHLDSRNGLAHDWVCCLWEDYEQNLWVGTGGGLNVLRPRRVQMVNAPDQWQGRAVLSVTTNSEGGLWIGTEGAGVYRFKDGAFTRLGETNGLPNLGISSLWEDRHRTLWVGTAGDGLYAWRGQGFQAATGSRLETHVLALQELADGTLWVGTETGPACVERGQWTWAAREVGLNIPHVRCFAQTADGALWFGSLGAGLARVQSGSITFWRQADGLASDYVWSLHAEPEGTLWIGTYGGGLSRFKNGRWATLGSRQGLPSDVICCILDDNQGNLWMSSYAGIFCAARADLESCADGQLKFINCLRLDTTDGLTTLEMSGGCQPAGCRTADGRLWFATAKGLAVVDPATVQRNPMPPPVRIEEVLVDEQFSLGGRRVASGKAAAASLRPPSGLYVPPGKNRLEIRYTGLSFGGAEKVRFKYKLHGLDDDWVEAGSRRFAFYSQLPPGDYLFRVKACNSDGVWNETGVSLPLIVAPFFWQVYWFQALALLTLLAGVGGTIALVQRRQHRRQLQALQMQQALERERVRIAQDIHDDVGSGLTQLLLLGKLAQRPSLSPEQVRTQVVTMTQRTREIVRAMDEIVWAVNPQNDSLPSLASYLSACTQEFLDAAGIHCRLDVAAELPPIPLSVQVRHNLFLAFKEALNNAAKHSGATEVWLRVHWAAGALDIRLEDNGRGFDPAAAADTGNGLTNLRERLQAIGGCCEIQSTLAAGCRIHFRLPLEG